MLHAITQFNVTNTPLMPVDGPCCPSVPQPERVACHVWPLQRTERMLLRSAMMGVLQEQKAAMDLIRRHKNMMPQQVRQLVGDDGHFGVQRSSERILRLVQTGAGSQHEHYAAVVDELLRNIERIQREPRADLPQLALDTLNNVQQTLNTWWREHAKQSA